MTDIFLLIPCLNKAKKELSLECSIAKPSGVCVVGGYCVAVLQDLWWWLYSFM